jgi:hypothetical protein
VPNTSEISRKADDLVAFRAEPSIPGHFLGGNRVAIRGLDSPLPRLCGFDSRCVSSPELAHTTAKASNAAAAAGTAIAPSP